MMMSVSSSLHRELRRRFELARVHRAIAQKLDPGHRLDFLAGEGGAERLGPVEVIGHHRDDLREDDQRLDARVPRQELQRVRQIVALQARIAAVLQPFPGVEQLVGKGRCHQHLGQQLIRVKRDRRQHLVELRRAERRRRRGERSLLRLGAGSAAPVGHNPMEGAAISNGNAANKARWLRCCIGASAG